ncbi:MAG: DUF1638 domain-containing protein [Acidimicrobiia bacterium]|nr:MAG: DUF1638 domain-containing protein [Acidimicrobiia bacterium]
MSPEKVLVLSCGALAKEVLDVVARNRIEHIKVEFLPASLHNNPSLIPDAVEERLSRGDYDRALVGYGDCGTAGSLDAVLEKFGVERLPGSHCYEFFTTSDVFATIHEDDPRTFYLTDFLVRHFERLVWVGLGLDRHPELMEEYFRNYERVVYLSQFPSAETLTDARRCADKLKLRFEHRHVGLGALEATIVALPSLTVAKAGV